MQFKTTRRHQHTSFRIAVINKSTKTSVGEDVKRGKRFCTVGGNADWCGPCGKQYGDTSKSQKWNYFLTQQSHFWEYI